MDSRHVAHRCEICRRTERLGKHATQELVRGERSCNNAAEEHPEGWIHLCGQCHGSVHRRIEDHPDEPGIQVEAVEYVIDRLEQAFLGKTPAKRRQITTMEERA